MSNNEISGKIKTVLETFPSPTVYVHFFLLFFFFKLKAYSKISILKY